MNLTEFVLNLNINPLNKISKKPSPINKIEYIIKSNSINLLRVDIPPITDESLNNKSTFDSPSTDCKYEYTKSVIEYDYNKDRIYNWKLTNENTIKKLFKNVDLTKPFVLRGNWENNKNLKHGWMVPCYLCRQLTTRKISYLELHIVYACKDCLPKNTIDKI